MTMYNVKDGKIISFFEGDSSIDTRRRSNYNEEDIKEIAESYLIENNLLDRYKLESVIYDEMMKVYKVSYYYYVGEYRTTDLIYFQINDNGNIISFAHPREGEFDRLQKTSKAKEELEKIAKESLKNSYGNDVEFTFGNVIITNENGNYQYLVYPLVENAKTEKSVLETVHIDIS